LAPAQAKLPDWYRALAVVVGLISISLAFVVLLDPGLALLTIVFLLGFALLVMGIDRVIAGITGHPFGWMPTETQRMLGVTPPGPGRNPPLNPPGPS
jgi:uncharacterized membrane protein HdeD (DUF308 family)